MQKMKSNKNQSVIKRVFLILIVTVCIWGILYALTDTVPVQNLENKTYDWRVKLRQHGPAISPDIVIVAIDKIDSTKASDDFIVMKAMGECGAKVIAYDVLIGDSYMQNIKDINKARDILERFPIKLISRLNDKREIQWPYGPFSTANGRENIGCANVEPDSDGVIRRQPPYFTTKKGESPPALPFLIAMKYEEKSLATKNNELHLGERPVKTLNMRMMINFTGPPGTIRAIPFSEVCDKVKQEDTDYLNKHFQGKIVLIGVTDPTEKDDFLTPYNTSPNNSMFGIEVIANSVNTIIQETYIKVPEKWAQGLILFLLCLGVSLCTFIYRPQIGLLISIIIWLLYILLCVYLFNVHRIWLNMVIPLMSVPLTISAVFAYRHFTLSSMQNGRETRITKAKEELDIAGESEVFISYARSDRNKVIPVIQGLQDAGIPVWIDEISIEGASLWKKEIVEAIGKCKVLLLFLSETSVNSYNVVKEVTLASDENKHILPLMLEPVHIPSTMKYQLAGIQHIELYKSDFQGDISAIIRSLAHLGVTVARNIQKNASEPDSSSS